MRDRVNRKTVLSVFRVQAKALNFVEIVELLLRMDHITADEIKNFLWSEGDLSYKLDPLQISISNQVRSNWDSYKKIGVLSSRQLGKSFWAVTFALEFLIRNPNSIARVIAPTKEKSEEIVEDNLNVVLADAPRGLINRYSSKNRWNLSNGSSLRLGALERQYVDKNRGGNAKLIIYEECGFVCGDDFIYGVNSVIGPQLIRSKGHEIFVSSPAEQPDHPLHTIVQPACAAHNTLFNYMVFESPSISDQALIEAAGRTGTILPIDFVQDVRKKVSKKQFNADDVLQLANERNIFLTDGFRREFMAMIIRPTTLMVIPIFSEKDIVIDFDVPSVCTWQVVVDWGGVRDKTVAFLMSYDFNSDTDLIVDELVFDANTSTDVIVRTLKTWDDVANSAVKVPVWADVPGQLQVDLLNLFDYQVQIPQKTNWLGAVNTMASRFATKNIRIKPKCKFLIDSVRSGMFNKNKTDFARTSELGHMDALAALMYGIRSLNRENPYAAHYDQDPFNQPVHSQNMFIPSQAHEENNVKIFGEGPKKFGSFK